MFTVRCPGELQTTLIDITESKPELLPRFAYTLARLIGKCLDEKGYDVNTVELFSDSVKWSFGWVLTYKDGRQLVGGLNYNLNDDSWTLNT